MSYASPQIISYMERAFAVQREIACWNGSGPAIRIQSANGVMWVNLAYIHCFPEKTLLDSTIVSMATPSDDLPDFAERFRQTLLTGTGRLIKHRNHAKGLDYDHKKRRHKTRIETAKHLLKQYPELDEDLLQIARYASSRGNWALPGDARYDFAELKQVVYDPSCDPAARRLFVQLMVALPDELNVLREHSREQALRR